MYPDAMLLLLVIPLLRTVGSTHHRQQCSNITDGTSPTSTDCPITMHGGNSSESHVTSVLKLLNVLQWTHTILLFDHKHKHDLQLLLHRLKLTSTYDLSDLHSSVELKQLLQQLHKKFFPRLNFLLLSNCSRAMQILQIVDHFDLESNRTTDFRHHSFWMVLGSGFCQRSSGPAHIYHLENVVLVSSEMCSPVCPCRSHALLQRLVTSPEGRSFTSVIDLEQVKDNIDIFPNIRYGLNNRTLVVSTNQDKSKIFVVKTENGYHGYCIEFLVALATALNFSYEIVQPADMQWGGKVNGKWNGLVGQLERREVDLVIAPLTIHDDREKVMDFLYPPFFTQLDDIIYRLQPAESVGWKIYLKPFRSLVLLLLLLTLVCATIMAFVLTWCGDGFRSDSRRRSGKDILRVTTSCVYNMVDRLVYLFGIMITRGVAYHPRSQSLRVFLFTWGVFSVMIAAYYSAHLVSVFAVKKSKLPFTSLGDLVRQTEYKWGFQSGAIREHIFKSSRSGDLRLAWEGVLELNRTDSHVLSDNETVHIAKVKDEKYALITARFMAERLRDGDCNIRYVGQDIIWHHFGIGVPTDFPLSGEIEKVLSRVADSGLPDVWWQRWNKPTEECMKDNSAKPLSLVDVSSTFYLLCVGLGAAGIVLGVEVVNRCVYKVV